MSQFPWKKILSSLLLAGGIASISLAVQAVEPSGSGKTELAQATPAQVTDDIPSTFYEPAGDSLKDVFNRAFYHDTGRAYDIIGISGQANNIFGWRDFPGSFFDNQIANDGLTVNTVYEDALKQQASGPRLVTRDLPNPFETSLQENPAYVRFEKPPSSPNTFEWGQPPALPALP